MREIYITQKYFHALCLTGRIRSFNRLPLYDIQGNPLMQRSVRQDGTREPLAEREMANYSLNKSGEIIFVSNPKATNKIPI